MKQIFMWVMAYFFTISSLVAQQESKAVEVVGNDSNLYYQDVSDNLMLNARSLMRSYDLNVRHVDSDTELQLSPLGQMSLGLGLNYKWFGIAANFGLPSSPEEIERYGETSKQDLHIGMYGNQASGFVNLQRYKGFHLRNYVDTATGNHVKIPSLETFSLNFSGLYFFNHKKFSFKSAYVRNAIQKKSAGSVALGAYLTYDASTSDVPLGDAGLPDSIQNKFGVLAIWSRTYGVSLGYSYTWVIKKNFFINGTLVPGMGAKKIRLTLSDESVEFDAGLAFRFDANIAMGYEAKNWLAGITASTMNQIYEINGLVVSPSSTSMKFFVAKRFGLGKSKKKKG